MLYLLQPIWLLAASGIILPVVIHLWNIKQGKTLKVGSIALLSHTVQEHARSLRLTELFLLFLRCLLIGLLSLLLAKPYWRSKQAGQGWVLMEKNDVQQGYRHFKPLIDSLRNAGYEFHFFNDRFEKNDLQSVLNDKTDTGPSSNTSYWKLIKQLDVALPPGLPVYVFTRDQLKRFTGDRPEVAIALNWQTFTAKDSMQTFISHAYMAIADSIIVTMGTTNPAVTVYSQKAIAINRPRQQDLVLSVADGSLSVAYKNNTPVLIDTTTVTVTVFAEKYLKDAMYIQAAIQSIQQVSRRKIKLLSVSDPHSIPAKQDWLFWLSDQQVTAKANNILAYQKGNAEPVQSWVNADGLDAQSIELYKRIPLQKMDAVNLWNDGFGIPLLTSEINSGQKYFRFYSHFNPSWNELTWSTSFPQLIYGLIDNSISNNEVAATDQRAIAEKMVQLVASNGKINTNKLTKADATTTKQFLWLIICIVFFTERYFSFKEKRVQVYA